MGRVKALYQEILERKSSTLENVPIEYTLSPYEMEEIQFEMNLEFINFSAQEAAELDKSESQVA